MEKLKRQDEAAGVAPVELSAEQREAIAEARRVCEARTAECRILFQSALASGRWIPPPARSWNPTTAAIWPASPPTATARSRRIREEPAG